jgi:hypothetical protein
MRNYIQTHYFCKLDQLKTLCIVNVEDLYKYSNGKTAVMRSYLKAAQPSLGLCVMDALMKFTKGSTLTYLTATLAARGVLFIISDDFVDVVSALCTTQFINYILNNSKHRLAVVDMRITSFIHQSELNLNLYQDLIRANDAQLDPRSSLNRNAMLHYTRLGSPNRWLWEHCHEMDLIKRRLDAFV